MLTYLYVGAFGSGLVYFANIAYERSKRHLAYFLLALLICFLCLVAGFRDLTVGTDVLVYGQHAFNIGIKYSLIDSFSFSLFRDWGPLYVVYSWIASRVGGNMTGYLFGIQLLIVMPAIFAIWKASPRYAYVGVLVYCLFFFPVSFNMIRQSAGMSFVLLAMVALLQSRWKASFVWLTVATLIHEAAIVCFIILPVAFLFRNAPKMRFVVLLCTLLLLYFSYPFLVDLLSNIGKYSTYLTGSRSEAGGGRRLNLELTISFMLLFHFYTSTNEKEGTSWQLRILLALLLISMAGIWLSVYSFYLYRIGFYFLIAGILAIPICMNDIKDRRRRMQFGLLSLSLLVLIHIDYFIIVGAHHVVPYALSI